MLDGSAYRVFAWPNESPNDAGRTLVANPADSVASPRGWHDIDNSAGADFTTTQGNNVNAYMDQDSNNAPDYRSAPSGGSSLRFDFPLDLTQHAQANRDAAVANLFYSNNMIHDVLYRYGFDEASGNFQENNYGRGGIGGDAVQAEAADGSGTNNANFSTPAADGGKPRMQMYLWPGNQLGAQNQVVIEGGATYGASWARFTPPATPAGLPGRTLVYGGTGCTDRCTRRRGPAGTGSRSSTAATTAVQHTCSAGGRPVAERRRGDRRGHRDRPDAADPHRLDERRPGRDPGGGRQRGRRRGDQGADRGRARAEGQRAPEPGPRRRSATATSTTASSSTSTATASRTASPAARRRRTA